MTRIQFWILTAGSSLVALLFLLQVLFSQSTQKAHADVLGAEQVINMGRTNEAQLRQLAARIYQVSQQTQDQGLKDLLARQQIIIKPPADGSTQAPAASSSPR